MADGMRSLITEGTVCKVSSSMGKEYSKDKMFDGSSETCWNSKEGKPQTITLRFDSPKTIRLLMMQFQGGFAPTECKILVEQCESGAKFRQIGTWFPANSNAQQTFTLQDQKGEGSGVAATTTTPAVPAQAPAPAPAAPPSSETATASSDDKAEGVAAATAGAGAAEVPSEKGGERSMVDASVSPANTESEVGVQTQALRLVMVDSTDFYGRVVVYALDVLGS